MEIKEKESNYGEISDLKKPRFGFIYVQTAILFLAATSEFFFRNHVGVALVEMNTPHPNAVSFNWTFHEQQIILSSFNWGYILMQYPGGYLAYRYGAHPVLLTSLFGASIVSFLTPHIVMWGDWQGYCLTRILQGLVQGVLWPSVIGHLSKWSPREDRAIHKMLMSSGSYCGLTLSMGLTGKIAGSSMGWPAISYVCGCLGLFTAILWGIFGASSPSASRFVSKEEKMFIINKLMEENRRDISTGKKQPFPFKQAFSSTAFLSLFVVLACQSFGMCIIYSELPLYLHNILKMDLKDNAVLTALPVIFGWIMVYVFLILGQFIMKRGILSLRGLRKSYNGFAVILPIIIFIALGFIGEEQKMLAIILIILCVGFSSSYDIAYYLNIMDLSPNFSSVIVGITNTAMTAMELVTPIVVSMVIKEDKEDRAKWQLVFAIGAALTTFGGLLYHIFGKVEVEPWDNPKSDQDKEEEMQKL
ncbi:hypothetical protein ACFFRR_004642 [Megaselia abdita]